MGHHFAAIADHSYDLDDEFDNYLQNDPALKKWEAFLTEVRFCNTHFKDFAMIPGEEVSCGNGRGQNVHMLVLNNPQFIPGAGDSGEKWLRTKPDLSIDKITAKPLNDTLYYAAHPEMPVPFLQRLLLRRNTWRRRDYRHTNLHGLQICNGHPDGILAGRQSWIKLLLRGEKKFILAGSDAHGNFNRFRQIGMPHLSMHEQDDFHLYGQHRTNVFIDKPLSVRSLMPALKNGAAAVHSGPFLSLTGFDDAGKKVQMGGTMRGAPVSLEISAFSTSEFGPLVRILLLKGTIGCRNESVLLDESTASKTFDYSMRIPLPLPPENGCYYRAEVYCASESPLPIMAMANPIWHFAEVNSY